MSVTRLRLLCLGALVATASGCLGPSHVIPREDLMQLAVTPPAQRGQRVRVIQQFSTSESPPAAPRVDSSVSVGVGVHVSAPLVRVVPRRQNQADLQGDRSKFWYILAAAAAIGLAATEGARYDGWVALHPMHPVHLYFPGGYTWVPLAYLTPETAVQVEKAVIVPSEGPWKKLGRAPLNRVGFTYGFLLGKGTVPTSDGFTFDAVSSHIQIGGFPIQSLGILLDLQAGWAEDDAGSAIYDSRTSAELQFLPIDLGILHGGGFAHAGLATRLDDGPGRDRSGLVLGAGPLVQLEITTRLAITARAAWTRVYDQNVGDFTVGLSIY